MGATDNIDNRLELRADGIIYAERSPHLPEASVRAFFEQARGLVAALRQDGKPILVLNHAHDTRVSEYVLSLLLQFDFDRMAVYGTSKRLNNQRDLMVRANGLEKKVASFATQAEALAWLRAAA